MELDSSAVETLSWECESGDYAFHKDDGWKYDEDDAFPVSEDKIDDLLGEFSSLSASFIIEDVEDYGQYGLDDPECTINIATESATYEIKLGDYSTMDSERYISIGDGNVYLVEDDPLEQYNVELSDLIDNDEIPDFDKTLELAFESVDNSYTATYQEDCEASYREDDVYFTSSDDGNVPLDTSKVDSYLNTVSALDLTDYVTYNATDEELATYGLDNPDLTVKVQYTLSEENEESSDDTESVQNFILYVSSDADESEDVETADAEDTSGTEDESDTQAEDDIVAYARVGESKIVYQLTGTEYEALMAYTLSDLRHSEIIPAEIDDVAQIDITMDGEDYTFTSEIKENDDETEKEVTWYYGEEELDPDELISAMETLSAESFIQEESTGKEEISMTLHLRVDGNPTVQITLYRYDGSDCVAMVDGEPLALVARSQVVDLIEAVNAIVLE
jgi:hypothetical protein